MPQYPRTLKPAVTVKINLERSYRSCTMFARRKIDRLGNTRNASFRSQPDLFQWLRTLDSPKKLPMITIRPFPIKKHYFDTPGSYSNRLKPGLNKLGNSTSEGRKWWSWQIQRHRIKKYDNRESERWNEKNCMLVWLDLVVERLTAQFLRKKVFAAVNLAMSTKDN